MTHVEEKIWNQPCCTQLAVLMASALELLCPKPAWVCTRGYSFCSNHQCWPTWKSSGDPVEPSLCLLLAQAGTEPTHMALHLQQN